MFSEELEASDQSICLSPGKSFLASRAHQRISVSVPASIVQHLWPDTTLYAFFSIAIHVEFKSAAVVLQHGRLGWQKQGYRLCCSNRFPMGRINGISREYRPEISRQVGQPRGSIRVENLYRHSRGRLNTAIVDLHIDAVDTSTLWIAMFKPTFKGGIIHLVHIHLISRDGAFQRIDFDIGTLPPPRGIAKRDMLKRIFKRSGHS